MIRFKMALLMLAASLLGAGPAQAFTSDTLGNVEDDGEYMTISTSRAWTADALGLWLDHDAQLFEDIGIEGSGARLNGLQTGYYEIDWFLETSEPDRNRDVFYFWDGAGLQLLGDTSAAKFCARTASGRCSATRSLSALMTSTVKVMSSSFALLVLDTENAYGTSLMKVANIQRVGDLEGEDPAIAAANIVEAEEREAAIAEREVSQGLRAVYHNEAYSTISTDYGTASREALVAVLGEGLPVGDRGSFNQWQLAPGSYEVTWQGTAGEVFYWWDGQQLHGLMGDDT
jgi:hypothetical protein